MWIGRFHAMLVPRPVGEIRVVASGSGEITGPTVSPLLFLLLERVSGAECRPGVTVKQVDPP